MGASNEIAREKRMEMRLSKLAIFLVSLLLLSCVNSNPMFEQNHSIANERWDKNELVRMDVPVTDTLGFYDIFINVRNVNSYPYSNLFLFVSVNAPNGATVTDTVEYNLADEYGKWLGESASRMWSCKLPFRTMVRFAQAGTYTFSIQQGMRDDELEGISDVGLYVEPITDQPSR